MVYYEVEMSVQHVGGDGLRFTLDDKFRSLDDAHRAILVATKNAERGGAYAVTARIVGDAGKTHSTFNGGYGKNLYGTMVQLLGASGSNLTAVVNLMENDPVYVSGEYEEIPT